jgi:GTP-binding protein Era
MLRKNGEMPKSHKSGKVSIVGLPNAGKSTLLNALVGEKLAIVSSKPQTTRTQVQGVLTTDEAQIVFLDTPGIHKSDSLINRRMMRAVRASLDALDAVIYVADATQPVTEEQEQALDLLKKSAVPAVLVVNKIDRLEKRPQVLEVLQRFQTLYDFTEFIPISAQTGEGLDTLRACLLKLLPEGEAIYADDHITDLPSRFLAAEMIREQILAETRQEVPHAIAVMVDNWEDTPKLTRIAATIYVERTGQKTIVVGQGGAMIKKIGTASRLQIEEFFEKKVFLELFVKVKPDWRNNAEFLNELDWLKTTSDSGDDAQ